MPAKQKLSQRKALKSAAAKKGWEARRKAEAAYWGYPLTIWTFVRKLVGR